MKKLIFFAVLTSLLFSLMAFSPVKANEKIAPTNQAVDECGTEQFIVLIDFSGSMRRNDPTQLRFTGPLHLADVLASHYLNSQISADQHKIVKKLELAVVQFATEANVGLEWTTIAPSNYDAWNIQRQEIAQQLKFSLDGEEKLQSKIGATTNYKNGYSKVLELVQRKGEPENGCPKRTLMFFTDGVPTDANGLLNSGLDEYMLGPISEGRTGGFLGMVSSTFNGIGDRIYVSAINDSLDNYWPDAKKYWQAVTCEDPQYRDDPADNFWKAFKCDSPEWAEGEPKRADDVLTPAELGLRIDQIVFHRLGSGLVVIEPGPVIVPPYLDKMSFTFYKPDVNNLIELIDQAGNRLGCDHPRVTCYGETEGIQTLQVSRPEPGRYELYTNANSDQYIVTQELIFAQGISNQASQKLQQFTTSQIELKLVDRNGDPLPAYDKKYNLLVDAKIIPPAETGASPYAISLVDIGSGTLQGNFTPIYAGVNHLSVTAVALNDVGQKIEVLKPPLADADFLVDAVAISAGQVAGAQEQLGCGATQFVPISLPLQLINTQTQLPAVISLPVEWRIKAEDLRSSSISGPDANQVFQLTAVIDSAGDVPLTIEAQVPDPNNPANKISISNQIVELNLAEAFKYEFSNLSLGSASPAVLSPFNRFLQPSLDASQQVTWLTGRDFFFFSKAVQADISVREVTSSGKLIPAEALPLLTFSPLDGKEKISGGSWTRTAENLEVLQNSTSGLGLGCYQVEVASQAETCGIVAAYEQTPQTVCVVPGPWERLIELVILSLIVMAIVYLIRYLICRFSNPLWGKLEIHHINGGRVWWTSLIDNSSCWNFKIDSPERNGNVLRISIYGAFRSKGTFKLRYDWLVTRAGKPVVETVYKECDLNHWRDITLETGVQIKWIRQ